MIVTSGARSIVPREPLNPFPATLWGMAKSLAREHPELNNICLDLDPNCTDVQQTIQGIVNELWSTDNESYVALRGPNRHVSRLRHHNLLDDTLLLPNAPSYRLTKGRALEELSILLSHSSVHLLHEASCNLFWLQF